MTVRRIIHCLLPAVVILCSCIRETPDDAFLNLNEPELKIAGRKVLEYSPADCQLSYSPSDRKFCVTADDGTRYFTVTLDRIPGGEGESVLADLRWTSGSSLKSREKVTFTVCKTDDDKIWLWNRGLNIEVSLRILR
ncbi:MAG: hypothetical protein MJY61_03300 [Bacteroidales bacterium]|nr:hypothetical protein [Bacteroidales bacterium]